MNFLNQNFNQIKENFKHYLFTQDDVITYNGSTLILYKVRWTFYSRVSTMTYIVDKKNDTYAQIENNRIKTVKGALRALGIN